MKTTVPPELLTVHQVAAMLGLSVRSVQRLSATGEIPRGLKIGRAKRWRRSDIMAWIEAGCQPAARGRA